MFAFCSCDVPQQESGPVTATIKVKDYGTIELELYPETAPITVANFAALAKDGFYEGKIFHRVISGFMIQGGSSDGLGYEGSEHCIKGEFSANGVENNISHERGVISMARTMQSNDSASSQFFIVHEDYPSLDGQYAAFGKVTSGIEVVDAIAAVATDSSDKPLEDVIIESVTVNGGNIGAPEYVD
ncbi:MAG: peptidylprolyl isomerase [Clostridia bacterium]|nr:peptidylprolyl isomerase [Clostridia bacterium]